MSHLIDADALEREGWMMHRTVQVDKDTMSYQTKKPTDFPTIDPEQPEVMSDGTLHITVDLDISKVDRILLSQKGTHYGDLYYADGEPKIGKWIPHNTHYTFVTGETSDGGVKCSSCGFETHNKTHITFGCPYNFCPNCGSYNGGEANE